MEWVQVGNETHQGMLFPTGQTTSEEGRVNFASFVTAGYDAVKKSIRKPKLLFILTKEIMPACTIGSSATYTKTMPNGTSSVCHFIRTYQPKTHTHRTTGEAMNNDCIANMKALIAKYNTPVMMCEIGISWDYEEAEAFYTDFVTKAKQVDQCLGVFTWEPQCYGNWKGYSKGMFDDSGKPTNSFNAFKR